MTTVSAADPDLYIEPAPIDGAEARELLARYAEELDQRFPAGFDVDQAAPPPPGAFTPPAGVFLVLRVGGRALGCGALRVDRASGRHLGEIRRMWISPELRGRGAGRALLAALEDWARHYDCRAVRLDTAGELREAHGLYLSCGYREIPAYNDNSYAAHWFEKALQQGPGEDPE